MTVRVLSKLILVLFSFLYFSCIFFTTKHIKIQNSVQTIINQYQQIYLSEIEPRNRTWKLNTEIWTQRTPIKINRPASSLFTKSTPISKLETHQSRLETQNQIQFGDIKSSNHQNTNPVNQTLKKVEITYKQLPAFHTNNKPRIFKETNWPQLSSPTPNPEISSTNSENQIQEHKKIKPRTHEHKPRKSNTTPTQIWTKYPQNH